MTRLRKVETEARERSSMSLNSRTIIAVFRQETQSTLRRKNIVKLTLCAPWLFIAQRHTS